MSVLRRYLEFMADFQEKNFGRDPLIEQPVPKAPARFVLDNGRIFDFGPDSFAGRRSKAKMCFMNAGRKALDHPALTYVEGYVQSFIPIEHAWLIDRAGRVIDPTLTGERVGEYFGVPISTDYLRKTLMRNKVWGVFGYWNWEQILQDDPADIIAKIGEMQS